jgi:hypothetical protein
VAIHPAKLPHAISSETTHAHLSGDMIINLAADRPMNSTDEA